MSMKAKILDVESTKEAPACNDAVVQTTKGCYLSAILCSHVCSPYFAYFFQALTNASEIAVIVAFRVSFFEILDGVLVKSIFIVLTSIAFLLLVKKALQLKAQGCYNAIFVALISLAQVAIVVELIADVIAPDNQTFNLILAYISIFVGVIVLLGTCCRPAGSSFIRLLGGATLVVGLVQFIIVELNARQPAIAALITILSLIAYALDITVIVNFIDSFDEM